MAEITSETIFAVPSQALVLLGFILHSIKWFDVDSGGLVLLYLFIVLLWLQPLGYKCVNVIYVF